MNVINILAVWDVNTIESLKVRNIQYVMDG
jgi:hypothetical protein